MKRKDFLKVKRTECYIKMYGYGRIKFMNIETSFYYDENKCLCAKLKLPKSNQDLEKFFNKYYNEKKIEEVTKAVFFIPGNYEQDLSFEDIVELKVENGYLYITALPDQIYYDKD